MSRMFSNHQKEKPQATTYRNAVYGPVRTVLREDGVSRPLLLDNYFNIVVMEIFTDYKKIVFDKSF